MVIDTVSRKQFTLKSQGFRYRRGMWAAIMELNITQELANIYQDPLFLLLLDLRKAYETVDQ